MSDGILLHSRDDVERLLTPDACILAVEDAFRQLAEGKAPPRRLPSIAARLMLMQEPDSLFPKRSIS